MANNVPAGMLSSQSGFSGTCWPVGFAYENLAMVGRIAFVAAVERS